MAKKSLADRKAALQAELEKVENAEKAEQEDREALIGREIYKAMQNDTELKRRVDELLMANLKKNSERAIFGLSKLQSNRGRKASEPA